MQGSEAQDKEFLNYSNCNEKGSTFLNSNIIIEKNTLSPKWIMDHGEVKKKKTQFGGLQESIQKMSTAYTMMLIVDMERSRRIHLVNVGDEKG